MVKCHRLPEMVNSGPIHPDNPVIARYQPVGLMQSKCFTESRGALGCVNCHEPHSRVATDHAAYEAICLSCHIRHSSPAARSRLFQIASIATCRGAMLAVECSFTDHWIRIMPRPVPKSGTPEAKLGSEKATGTTVID